MTWERLTDLLKAGQAKKLVPEFLKDSRRALSIRDYRARAFRAAGPSDHDPTQSPVARSPVRVRRVECFHFDRDKPGSGLDAAEDFSELAFAGADVEHGVVRGMFEIQFQLLSNVGNDVGMYTV